jgi:hypothetical protein
LENSERTGVDINRRILKGFGICTSLKIIENEGADLVNDRIGLEEILTRIGASQIHNLGKANFVEFQDVLLIANRPIRTKNYLMALALRIPIISSLWIKDCYSQNLLLSYEEYRLANGDSKLLQTSCASKRPPNTKIFTNQTVHSTFLLT